MWRIIIGFLALISSTAIWGQSIDEAYVTRLISTLASDEMEGRKSGTPGCEKAATFIAAEFKNIGLDFYEGNSYLQKFSIRQVSAGKRQLVLNGQPIAEGDFIANFDEETLKISNPSELEVVTVGPEDNLFQILRKPGKSIKPLFLLVDPVHKGRSRRYRKYIEERMVAGSEAGRRWIACHTTAKTVESISLECRNKLGDIQLANVVGVLPGKGKKDEIVLFSAHYDHLGRLAPVEDDDIANGADDDGSGTTAVIALARYFKQMGNPERTLVFVAFTAEEIGGFGSLHLAGKINPDRYIAGVNIEMIGKLSKFGPGQAFITGFEKSDLGTILQANSKGKAFGFHPDPYPEKNLFYRSDNATFARMGIPAHSVSTDKIDQDPYYHTVNDELETLDLTNMTLVIRAIAESVSSLVDGTDTPSRLPIR